MKEVRTTNVNRVIVIPYGWPTNFDLTEAKVGDILVFKDNKKSRIEGTCTMMTSSPAFDTICQMVYGIPAIEVMKEWKKKYNNDVQYDHALIITYNAKFL